MVCELLFLMNHLIAPAVSPIKIYGLSKWDKSLVHFPITLWFPINDHYQDLLPQTPEIFLPLKQHHLNAPWPPQTSPTPTASLHQWYHLGSNSYQGNLNHLPSFILPLSSWLGASMTLLSMMTMVARFTLTFSTLCMVQAVHSPSLVSNPVSGFPSICPKFY